MAAAEKPARCSSTASNSDRRPASRPWALRRGGTFGWFSGLVSACTSTNERAVPVERGHGDRAGDPRPPVGEEEAAGVGHAAHAGAGHLEHAEVAGGPEAVLRCPQQPEMVVAVAFEAEHRVDHVLEHARPGQAALLGDVTDEDHGDAARLGLGDQPLGARLDLHDRTRRRPDRWVGHRLDAVDHDQLGLRGDDRLDHGIEVGLGVQPQVGSVDAETFRPLAHLLRALLAGDVEARCRPGGEQLHQQRALADARFAAEQRDRAGDEAAAEHPVELGEPGATRARGQRVDVGDADRPRPAGRARQRDPRRPPSSPPTSSTPHTSDSARPTSGAHCRTRCTRVAGVVCSSRRRYARPVTRLGRARCDRHRRPRSTKIVSCTKQFRQTARVAERPV